MKQFCVRDGILIKKKMFEIISMALLIALPLIMSVAQASSSGSNSKPLHFYFHYSDAPVSVAGVQTHYIMNTTKWFRFLTQKEAYANSFYKPVGLPKIVVDFYLYPNLAGQVTADGTWQVFVWVNSSAYKPCGFNVEFREITVGGTMLWSSGALNPTVTSTVGAYIDVPIYCYNLSYTPLAHTFSADTTILAEVTINPGASTDCRVWYDSPLYPSKVIIPCQDYARPSSVKTYNANYSETNMFSVFWSENQRRVVVRANVTDPFGGYDIYMVNLTIIDPAKRVVLDNVDMVRISDGLWALHYSHIYESSWHYADTAVSGNYTVIVSVIDNNGYYYYLAYGIFNPYIEFGYHVFSIGVQYSIQIKTVDAHNQTMVNAYVCAVSAGIALATGYTNASGWWNTALWAGYYNIIVYWQGVEVLKQPTEISKPSTFTIQCRVFYPTFEMVDDANEPLPEAQVYIKSPNGTTNILPIYTALNGFVNLTQAPAGNYEIAILWKGVIVKTTTQAVDSDGPYTIKCQVYQLATKALDDRGAPIQGAYMAVYTQAGIVYDFKTTDSAGQAVFKIPVGTYKFTVLWRGVVVQQTTRNVDSSGSYTISCQVYELTVQVLGNNGAAIEGAYVIVYTPTGNDFKMTNASGLTIFKLPVGTYKIETYYSTAYWLTHVAVSTTEPSISVTSSGTLKIALAGFPPPIWMTIGFWLIVSFVVIAALGLVYFLYKRRHSIQSKSAN